MPQETEDISDLGFVDPSLKNTDGFVFSEFVMVIVNLSLMKIIAGILISMYSQS